MEKRRVIEKMNRKLAALMIPLLLLPMVAFGYAHFTDEVIKKYKIHVGSVILNVTGFHVDYAKMPDVDNDGIIFGDELNITVYEDTDCRWYILIEANPITGGFVLNTTMTMHNAGKLPFRLWWEVKWDGPYDTDPCYATPPAKDWNWTWGVQNGNPWSYYMEVYKRNATGTFGPVGTTQEEYKPCNDIIVKQHVDFRQPDPGQTYQKDWQCKWIKIWVTFRAIDEWKEISSYYPPITPLP